MELIAHRGFASVAPENTVRALSGAADRGADAVEFDVRTCGSGEAVVVHDATVDRVTGATGRVADLTADELAALDVLGSGEGVPTLEAVLAALPPDLGIHAEFKDPAADAAVPALVAAPNPVVVSSFEPGILAAVTEREPRLDTAFLYVEGDGAALSRATRLGCSAVHPETDLALADGFVAEAHRRNLAVNAWTVDDAGVARDLRAAGVDGVIADDPDVIR